MDIDIRGFDGVHLWGDSATHSPAPHSPRHAALLLLAGMSLPRPRALPGTPITALASTSNYRFQVKCPAPSLRTSIGVACELILYGADLNFVAHNLRNFPESATYVLIAVVKKELQLDASLYTCLQILSVSVFEKTQLSCALQPDDSRTEPPHHDNQLILFNF